MQYYCQQSPLRHLNIFSSKFYNFSQRRFEMSESKGEFWLENLIFYVIDMKTYINKVLNTLFFFQYDFEPSFFFLFVHRWSEARVSWEEGNRSSFFFVREWWRWTRRFVRLQETNSGKVKVSIGKSSKIFQANIGTVIGRWRRKEFTSFENTRFSGTNWPLEGKRFQENYHDGWSWYFNM